jgi:hypothetical protein
VPVQISIAWCGTTNPSSYRLLDRTRYVWRGMEWSLQCCLFCWCQAYWSWFQGSVGMGPLWLQTLSSLLGVQRLLCVSLVATEDVTKRSSV